jgi:hypothetical protein
VEALDREFAGRIGIIGSMCISVVEPAASVLLVLLRERRERVPMVSQTPTPCFPAGVSSPLLTSLV